MHMRIKIEQFQPQSDQDSVLMRVTFPCGAHFELWEATGERALGYVVLYASVPGAEDAECWDFADIDEANAFMLEEAKRRFPPTLH